MTTYIFTDKMYDRLRMKSYDLLSRENNKIVYDLLLDDIIAVPDNQYFEFTVPIMISKGEEFFISEVNKKITLNDYLSEIEIALGSKLFKNDRLRHIARKLFNKNDMRNYDVVKEIVERNDYSVEKSLGQYSAWLDTNLINIAREVMK